MRKKNVESIGFHLQNLRYVTHKSDWQFFYYLSCEKHQTVSEKFSDHKIPVDQNVYTLQKSYIVSIYSNILHVIEDFPIWVGIY